MKILVFDDTQIHRDAAVALLKGHTVTVVGTYDEAEKLLLPVIDWERADQQLKAEFGDFDPYRSSDEERIAAYRSASKKAHADATTYPDFDVVLTDLLIPASRNMQGRDLAGLVGKEMPLGTVIVLRALAARVKLVALVTDMNHHEHPASAAIDKFPLIRIGDTRVFCTNHPNFVTWADAETFQTLDWRFLESDEGKQKYPRQPDYTYRGAVKVKDWKLVLETLLKGQEED